MDFNIIWIEICFYCFIIINHPVISDVKEATRITKAKIADFPYTAQISIKNVDPEVRSVYCPGTIIGTKWILASPSCRGNMSRMSVFVGSDKLFEGTEFEVAEIHTMPNVVQGINYPEYMVLELQLDLEYGDEVMNVQLGGISEENIVDDNTGNITGFTHENAQSDNLVLHVVKLPIVTYKSCITKYPAYEHVLHTRDFCIGQNAQGKAACFGQIGDPIVINYRVVGIAKEIGRCGSWGSPSIFSNIPYARDWICNITGI